MAGGASQAVAQGPAHITGVSSMVQLLGLSWIFEEESKDLLQCFCARGGCATEPDCLGQPRSEEAAAVHGQGSRCPQAGGRVSAGFSWRGDICGGGSWRREPSLRKEHGRKRLKESAADVGVEEKAGKGVCPYGEEDTDSVRCERKG